MLSHTHTHTHTLKVLSPPPRLTSPQRWGKWKGFLREGGREKKEEEGEGDKSKANFSLGQFLNDDNLILSVCTMVVLMFELLPNLLCPLSFFPFYYFFSSSLSLASSFFPFFLSSIPRLLSLFSFLNLLFFPYLLLGLTVSCLPTSFQYIA